MSRLQGNDEEQKYQRVVAERVASFRNDPLSFVRWVFPWGVEGTRLANEEGPDKWQSMVLADVRDALSKGGTIEEGLQYAVRSGHGVGKTALVAWIILWFISTRPDPQIVVTANTKQQLTTKTWRELAKWLELSFISDWFEHTGTQLKSVLRPKTWFATAIAWSESNSEAFAGTHEKHVLYLFDEASAIADIIWEVSEGAMTTAGAMWFAFGNPTKTSGRFSECWKKFKKRWRTFQVDSRDAKMANQKKIAGWIEDYGIDSDFARVRIRGMEPAQADMQLISRALVEAAMARQIERKYIARTTAKVMAWDIARGGGNASVGVCRLGRKLIPEATKKLENVRDLMVVASYIADHINEWRPDVVYIDCTGMGAGVFDRLVQLHHTNVVEFYGASREVLKPRTHYNKRIECWDAMRAWLKTADLPYDEDLIEQICGPQYYFRIDGTMILESKEDMADRGLVSPDYADAVSMTFAEPMAKAIGTNESDMEPDYE